MPKLSEIVAGPSAGPSLRLSQVVGQEPAPSLWERLTNAVQGNAVEHIPDVYSPEFEKTQAGGFLDHLKNAVEVTPSALFKTDADVAKKMVELNPGYSLDQDENGNTVVVTDKGQRFYANQPGLDMTDALRFGGLAASFLPAGRIARGPSLLARMGKMAVGAGTTDALGQSLSGQGVDPVQTGATAMFGAGAETLGPILSAVRRSVGKLGIGVAKPGELGRQMAKDLGLPDNLPEADYRHLEQLGQEVRAGADPATVPGQAQFGLQYTRGQKTGDFADLAREDALVRLPNSAGGARLRELGDQNRQATADTVQKWLRQYSGDTPPQSPVEAMQRVQGQVQDAAGQLRASVSQAYQAAGDGAAISRDSLNSLRSRIGEAIRAKDAPIHPRLTPEAANALKAIEEEVAQIPENAVGVKLNAAERMRGLLDGAIGAAKRSGNMRDVRAAANLKQAYSDWLDGVVDDALVRGDANAMDAIRRGRALRRQYGERFEGNGADAAIDNFIEHTVSGSHSAEELLNTALGMSQVSKASSNRFIARLKLALQDSPEAINDLKSAHVMRLMTDKTGQPLGFAAIRNNILSAEKTTPEVIRQLYTPKEWAQVRQFASAIRPLIATGDFARNPGTAPALLRYLQTLGQLPFLNRVSTAFQPLREAMAANRALSPVRPAYTPGGAQELVPTLGAAAGQQR